MSNLAIRQGLEMALKELSPQFPTAWENKEFSPITGEAYQEVYFLFAKPDNSTMGDNHFRQTGIMQVTLRYPKNTGARDAGLRAEVLQEAFYRGLSAIVSGVTTVVSETPEIGDGKNIGEHYVVIVRIRFYADLFKGDTPEAYQDARWREEEW